MTENEITDLRNTVFGTIINESENEIYTVLHNFYVEVYEECKKKSLSIPYVDNWLQSLLPKDTVSYRNWFQHRKESYGPGRFTTEIQNRKFEDYYRNYVAGYSYVYLRNLLEPFFWDKIREDYFWEITKQKFYSLKFQTIYVENEFYDCFVNRMRHFAFCKVGCKTEIFSWNYLNLFVRDYPPEQFNATTHFVGYKTKVFKQFVEDLKKYCKENNIKIRVPVIKNFDYDFWDAIKDFIIDYVPINPVTIKKNYQKNYYEINKPKIIEQRKKHKLNQSPESIISLRGTWKVASAKYKNKVCLYENKYYTLEQLQRKFKKSGLDTTTAKNYALNDSIQNAKCNYQGLEYTFIELCSELRIIDKLDNWVETALNSIIKNT